MNTYRLNITLPKKIVARLKDKPNKSAFIAEAVADKLDAEEKEKRSQELAAAYRQAALETENLVADWDAASGDGL